MEGLVEPTLLRVKEEEEELEIKEEEEDVEIKEEEEDVEIKEEEEELCIKQEGSDDGGSGSGRDLIHNEIAEAAGNPAALPANQPPDGQNRPAAAAAGRNRPAAAAAAGRNRPAAAAAGRNRPAAAAAGRNRPAAAAAGRNRPAAAAAGQNRPAAAAAGQNRPAAAAGRNRPSSPPRTFRSSEKRKLHRRLSLVNGLISESLLLLGKTPGRRSAHRRNAVHHLDSFDQTKATLLLHATQTLLHSISCDLNVISRDSCDSTC